MNLKQLRYFAKVVETGSITRAAELLGVAQPALGQQIRSLEEELGVPLLVRHSRGARTTPAGQLLAERAAAILADIDAVRRDVVAASGQVRERIRLGLAPSLMALIGTELALEARRAFPSIDLILVEEISFALADGVAGGELELALAFDVDEQPGLACTEILVEALVAVMPGSLRRRKSVPFAELLDQDLILSVPRDSIRRVVLAEAKRLGRTVTPSFEIQSVSAIKTMVARGLGVAVLPPASVMEEVSRGALHAAPVVEPQLLRRLCAVKSRSRGPFRQEAALLKMASSLIAAAGLPVTARRGTNTSSISARD